jgi:hypothetical protein
MQHLHRLILSILSVVIGVMVVGISLMSASNVASYSDAKASSKKFYFSPKILPDHVLYPVVAGMDRAILLAAPDEEKLYLYANYGWMRYEYAQKLLAKDSRDLALITLTKSQKYFSLALHQAQQPAMSVTARTYAVEQAKENISKANEMALHFVDSKRHVIMDLNRQNQALLEQVECLQ